MTESEDAGNESTGRRIKVARLIDEYDLNGLGAELEWRWTADDEDRLSLRALATHFNQHLLRTRMAQAGTQSLDGESENTYRLLTDDDVSDAERTRAVRRLERDGIDVDALRDDFVTYQAIRSYLQRERDAEYVTDGRDRTEAEAQNVQQLRGRITTVTEGKLDQLRKNEDIVLGEYSLFVDINVLCEDCGQRYEVTDLLERGDCDCADPEHPDES